jgi:TRAP-type C4-dicarboxylate transport system permease small subunit
MAGPKHPTLIALAHLKALLVRLLNGALILAVAVLVLDVLWGVATRYLLGEQSSWTEELARMLLIWVVLLGSAVAYGGREHLGLDYFVGRMDPVSRRRTAIVTDLVVLFFAVSVLLGGGYRRVYDTFELGQMLMALGIGKGFVYLAVPVSGAFFVLFGVESLMETLWGAPREGGDA